MNVQPVCFSDLNRPSPPPVWPRKCSCGAVYSREEWDRLPYVGTQDDGVEVVLLRNCARCKSTMAVVIGPSPKRKPTCAHCSEPIDGVRVCADEGAMHEVCARERYAHDAMVFQHPAAIFTSWVATKDARWLVAWRRFRRAFFG